MSMLDVYQEKFAAGNYHLGKLFMDCMKSKPPDGICQIDAATGERETNASVLARSIRLAKSLRKLGLKPGDVLLLGGRNHIDLHIPYYAALLNGLPVGGVDPFFKYEEIKGIFQQTKPKIAFCQYEMYKDYVRVAKDLGLDVKIVTFDEGDCTMSKFLELYDDKNAEDFQVAEFDTEKIYAWLVSTSGTTGVPKQAAFKHGPLITRILANVAMSSLKDYSGQVALNLSPVQWISSYYNAIVMPLSDIIKLQTSTPNDIGHHIDMINEYKPITLFTNSPAATLLLRHEKPCDWNCFDAVILTGSKIYKELMMELKARMRPDALAMIAYGQTETIGPVLIPNPFGDLESCGMPMPGVDIKLVDPATGKEITEPNVAGEVWTKGPCFTEYYNNPEETAKAFSEDGWYKSGDLLYRDEDDNYFFVDRIKTLMKYKNYHVSPTELEELIIRHEGVKEACVIGLPHDEDGEWPLACVVRSPGSVVTAQEIKDLVARNLSENKLLRGGVVFLDELPRTSTGKVVPGKLKSMVIQKIKSKI